MSTLLTLFAAATVAGITFFWVRKALENRRIYNFHDEA